MENSTEDQIARLEAMVASLTAEADKVRKQEFVKLGFRIAMVIVVLTFMLMCSTVLSSIPVMLKEPKTTSTATHTFNDTPPLNNIHYIAGSTAHGSGSGVITLGEPFDYYYYGRDYVRPHGSTIYAPFNGSVSYQSDIGGGTPQVTITNSDGESVHIMHLDSTKTSGTVSKCDVIGTTAANGAYSGGTPHEHVSYYVNGLLSDWETSGYSYETCVASITPADDFNYYYGIVVPCHIESVGNTNCRLSNYIPKNGGTNCAPPCTRTADGSDVQTLLNSGGCYVALSQELPFDTEVTINGTTCLKADNGGWILHVQPNQHDPACANALREGNMQACNGDTTNTTGSDYYWIDFLQ